MLEHPQFLRIPSIHFIGYGLKAVGLVGVRMLAAGYSVHAAAIRTVSEEPHAAASQ
jgi:hypothetical protein